MKKLKILFLSSEVAPFAKSGGLADVSISLPKGLRELGHEVRIIMPKYKDINDRKYVLRDVIRLKDIPIIIGDATKKINVKSSFTPDPVKIQTYFIDCRAYFGREGLYGAPNSNKDFQDNDERYILYAKGVLETLKLLYWQPDIIHCNDWQTGLVPLFVKTLYKDDEFFKKTSTVFTIHTVGDHGNFPPESFNKTNVDNGFFKPGITEHYGKFSFLKTGIYYSDYVTAVSSQLSGRVQDPEEYGLGLENIFKEQSNVLSGIINGVDYTVWNPETDEYISENYSAGDLSGKLENKKELVKKFKLPFDKDIPIIGILEKPADQHSLDLFEKILNTLLTMKMQFVVLGTGERKYQTLLNKINKKFPERFGVKLSFDTCLAHLMEAGSDMFLMPSRYESYGLNQLYSLKYGAVPVVQKNRGLAEAIEDFNPKTGKGNGFFFEHYGVQELFNTFNRAAIIFQDKKMWKKLMKNGMKQDFSWKSTARKYSKIYEKILKKKL